MVRLLKFFELRYVDDVYGFLAAMRQDIFMWRSGLVKGSQCLRERTQVWIIGLSF